MALDTLQKLGAFLVGIVDLKLESLVDFIMFIILALTNWITELTIESHVLGL